MTITCTNISPENREILMERLKEVVLRYVKIEHNNWYLIENNHLKYSFMDYLDKQFYDNDRPIWNIFFDNNEALITLIQKNHVITWKHIYDTSHSDDIDDDLRDDILSLDIDQPLDIPNKDIKPILKMLVNNLQPSIIVKEILDPLDTSFKGYIIDQKTIKGVIDSSSFEDLCGFYKEIIEPDTSFKMFDANTITNICSNLLKNYDARILLQEPLEIQQFINDTVKYLVDNNIAPQQLNKVLVQVIYNLYNKVQPDALYINGPFSMSEQTSDTYNKKIYIFGEYHGQEQQCDSKLDGVYSINNYLRDLFNSSPVFIDFFLEYRMFPNKYEAKVNINRNQLLYHIHELVDDCMDPVGRAVNCPWPNVRTHFVDTRYYKDISTTQIGVLKSELNKKLSPQSKQTLRYLATFQNDIEKLTSFSYQLAVRSVTHTEKGSRSNLNIEFIGPLLKKHIYKRLNINFMKTFQKNISVALAGNTSIPNYVTYLNILFTQLTMIETSVMDLYLLQRMFKTFRDTGLNQPRDSKNIILYVGDAHAILIRGVLRDMGFVTIGHSTPINSNTKKRCLSLAGIKQPLF